MKFNYRRIIAPLAVISLALLAGAGATASNQQKASPAPTPNVCPAVKMTCPDKVKDGEPITCTLDVKGGDENVSPTFNWDVSAGTISSGQGTSSITVDTGGAGGKTITATADVGGFDRHCPASASGKTAVAK
ncbi:MAG: hypothetical protein QOE33_2025 [Acidobacteriota bacterium]|nr:hypothetical protein [Acidobacteriota bacterium]